MSHFYGSVKGSKGEATRAGSQNSGYSATAAGWQGAIQVSLTSTNDGDYFEVWLSPWQGSGGHNTLLAKGRLDATSEVIGQAVSLRPEELHVDGKAELASLDRLTAFQAACRANPAE